MHKSVSSLKRTAPPIIILLDVLFVFMFSVLLETSHGIAVRLETGLPNNGALFVTEADRELLVYKNKNWQPISKIAKSINLTYYKIFPCNDSCVQFMPSSQLNDLGLLVYGKLYDDIARINFLACSLGNESCNSMKIYLSPDGINKDATLYNNSSLKHISGVVDYM